ncbi:phage virion morphogenesis protein [Moritella sp. Urea-trap-13]|uniref:phage virion morphogenesis protein n=1 Tax=Moritella sp. Urea-trap-13 TaxID=2058327 RepID=UPI000C33E8D0|nr:phage virion morphogenesis protein [Moritella sp. Urea-trap-13]PKH06667.1 phage virion morphogenesis protein [Moritella sp. Urea-trap-13]
MIRVSILEREILSVQQQLKLMTLPAEKRLKILRKLSRHLAKQNRKNIRENKDPDGRRWKHRSAGDKKMMRKMGKQLKTKTTANHATLFFPGVAGKIASQHQYGTTEKWNAAKARRVYGRPSYGDKPTRLQAKRLRELGYSIAAKRQGKRKGKSKRKKPTIKWIVENLTTGQAGLIIRALKDKTAQSSWEIKLPERQLLGANVEDITNFITAELEKE